MRTKLSIFGLILVPLVFVCAATSARQKPTTAGGLSLVETGEFHGDEVSARTGEKWLGLHISDHDSTLLNYQLTVQSVHDAVVDDDTDQETGKRISIDLPLQPIFLVKGAMMLSDGPVSTVFKGGNYEKTLKAESPIKLELAESSYELKVVGSEDTAKCPDESLPRNARLVLVSGESKQVLYSLEECGSDPSWYLIWAGDLDRDGKLDLYLNVSQHYNISEKKLFLSSQAGKGQLVKQVAEFVTSGC
jgi:hypothetical protein